MTIEHKQWKAYADDGTYNMCSIDECDKIEQSLKTGQATFSQEKYFIMPILIYGHIQLYQIEMKQINEYDITPDIEQIINNCEINEQQNKPYPHILWHNLICDNVYGIIQRRFYTLIHLNKNSETKLFVSKLTRNGELKIKKLKNDYICIHINI